MKKLIDGYHQLKKRNVPLWKERLERSWIFRSLFWLLWDFSGLRFFYRKIRPSLPSENKRPPSSIMIWAVAVYVALFWAAWQRYENAVDRVENRIGLIYAQISIEPLRKSGLSKIPDVQNHLCPPKPELLNPISIARSLLRTGIWEERSDELAKLIEMNKTDLGTVSLSGAYLQKADLRAADLKAADLEGADLWEAVLRGANLENAFLMDADLQGAFLMETNLQGANLKRVNACAAGFQWADLQRANLQGADLREANFMEANLGHANLKAADLKGAYFWSSDLSGTKGLRFEQLATVKTLYGAKGLEAGLEAQLKEEYPELFEEP
jgi:uncharacterized protein YjbI with pentapeptide repeats